jgi:RHS repeat-associated protein
MNFSSKHSPWVGIRNSTDYSPFGVELDGRTVSLDGYRFGYQGSEKDNEFKGEGNSYTTEFRQLDPRLGRWLSVDPVVQPWQSFYCSMDDNPVTHNDLLGNVTNDWIITYTVKADGTHVVHIKLTAASINNSDKKFNMKAFNNAVKSQIKESYSITYMDSETILKPKKMPGDRPDILVPQINYFKVQVEVDVEIRTIYNINQLNSKEHLIHIENSSEAKKQAGGENIYGQANMKGTDVLLNADIVQQIIDGNDKNTIPHEFGHSLGLEHIDQKAHDNKKNFQYIKNLSQNKDNIMMSGGSKYMNDLTSTKVSSWQIKWVINFYKNGELNQKN